MLPGALVAQAIEALLSGNSKSGAQALAPAITDLAAALAGLEQRVALLEQASPPAPPPAPPASPERVIPPPRMGEPVKPLRVPLGAGTLEIIGAGHLHPPAPAPAPPNQAVTIPQVGDAITTKALADLLQMRRGTLNARIARAGGALPGLVIEGWCCLGTQVPKRGGPAQALWQQV
jgi:hypothetical protein